MHIAFFSQIPKNLLTFVSLYVIISTEKVKGTKFQIKEKVKVNKNEKNHNEHKRERYTQYHA